MVAMGILMEALPMIKMARYDRNGSEEMGYSYGDVEWRRDGWKFGQWRAISLSDQACTSAHFLRIGMADWHSYTPLHNK